MMDWLPAITGVLLIVGAFASLIGGVWKIKKDDSKPKDFNW